MTYGQSLTYINTVLPNFQQVGSIAFQPSLEPIQAMCSELGSPQDQYPTVHIAGTNGKGSVASMLTSVLMEAGYTVGLFTSPHMQDPRERIRVNGKLIPKAEFAGFIANHQSKIEALRLSFFEVSVAMAFDWFARSKVDIAIIEAGMGGEWDATNLIKPELAIITNVSKDHVEWLGPTLEDIARNKAGIIKRDSRVVLGTMLPSLGAIFMEKVESTEAQLFPSPSWELTPLPGEHLHPRFNISLEGVTQYQDLKLDLYGAFQEDNLKIALTACQALQPKFPIDSKATLKGFANVRANTSLTGRMTLFTHTPPLLLDVGHNEAAVGQTFGKLALPHERLFVIWGMVKGKDHSGILGLLPHNATYFFVQPNLPRAKDATELAEMGKQQGLNSQAYATVSAGLQAALQQAFDNDLIFIGGSHFVVAEALTYIQKNLKGPEA